LQGGQVAVTDEDLGLPAGGGVVHPRQHALAAVAAAERKNGVHLRVPEHRIEIGEPLIVGAGEAAVGSRDVLAELEPIAESFEVTHPGRDPFRLRRAGRCDQSDDGPAAKAGRLK
jgi:hypothetical protein